MAGSLEKRGENSWRLIVSCGMDANGKQIKKTRTVKGLSPKEAEKALALFIAEVEKGQVVDSPKITLSSFVERWLKDYAETNLAPKTLYRYRQLLDSRILPALGHLRLQNIRPNHLLEFYKNLQEEGIREDVKCSVKSEEFNAIIRKKGLRIVDICRKSGMSDNTIHRARSGGSVTLKTAQALSSALDVELETLFTKQEPGSLSGQTVRHHHRLLSAILQDAVEWQALYSNPASRIKPPKVTKKQAVCYDEEQTAALLQAINGEPLQYQMIVILAISTGLRLGELMGLEWKGIDFDIGVLRVRKASQSLPKSYLEKNPLPKDIEKGENGVFTKPPKNETSVRLVSIPESVVTFLKKYKAFQSEERMKIADKWFESDRLFTTWDGHPMFPYTMSNWFPEFLKRHGLPHIPFHSLRHTAATLLIGRGLHAKTISSRLGHSNISTTMDIYGHALKSADREAADKLDNLFKGPDNAEQLKG